MLNTDSLPNAQRSIIVANGSINPGPALHEVLAMADGAVIVGADGGAEAALKLKLKPTLVIGDMDSLAVDTLGQLEQGGAEVIRFSPQKDETDLELAVLEATRRGAQWIRILGATGSRLDQTLSNIHLLTLDALRNKDVRLVDGRQTTWLIGAGKSVIDGQPGDTISLLPLRGDVRGIRTEGLEYALHDETLYFGPARGISNMLAAEEATIRIESGNLLVVHTIGQPE